MSKLNRLFRKGYSAFIDILFPIVCVSCYQPGVWLCENCLSGIKDYFDTCPFCGRSSLHGLTCFDCKKDHALNGIITVGSYQDEILRTAVHALKFEGVKDLSVILGHLLSKKINSVFSSPFKGQAEGDDSSFVLAPLPLHPRRERFRGFNQSQLIAKEISKKLNIPVLNLLKKIRSTSPQASIDSKFKDIRKQNISNVFEINEKYKDKVLARSEQKVSDKAISVELGRDCFIPLKLDSQRQQDLKFPQKVIIVDDVSTTGATLEEAAKVLADHGVKEIWGAVVCRG